MGNDKNYLIHIANKYSINPQMIERIYELMDDWFITKLIEDISRYPEANKILTN